MICSSPAFFKIQSLHSLLDQNKGDKIKPSILSNNFYELRIPAYRICVSITLYLHAELQAGPSASCKFYNFISVCMIIYLTSMWIHSCLVKQVQLNLSFKHHIYSVMWIRSIQTWMYNVSMMILCITKVWTVMITSKLCILTLFNWNQHKIRSDYKKILSGITSYIILIILLSKGIPLSLSFFLCFSI